MGVKSCSRRNCDSIMCDTIIDSIGYICADCESEFKNYLIREGINPKTSNKIKKELMKFMEFDIEGDEIDVYEFFENARRYNE